MEHLSHAEPAVKTLLVLLLLTTATPAVAEMHIITHDMGGVVVDYIQKYDQWSAHGDTVILDGTCWSACGYVTRIPTACATAGSVFAFHEAYYLHQNKRVYSAFLRNRTLSLYPPKVQREFIRRGGLTERWMYIRATDLLPECKG